MKILITGGGTEEVIDAARCISNFSTGKTACFLADQLAKKHEVSLVLNQKIDFYKVPINRFNFSSFNDLNSILHRILSNNFYDCIIHLAAVSDYSVSEIIANNKSLKPSSQLKIPSESDLQIVLSSNFKILDRLKSYSLNPKLKVIGFKLTKNTTAEASLQKVNKLLATKTVDYVVHNDLNDISAEIHRSQIFDNNAKCIAKGNNKEDLSNNIHKILEAL